MQHACPPINQVVIVSISRLLASLLVFGSRSHPDVFRSVQQYGDIDLSRDFGRREDRKGFGQER